MNEEFDDLLAAQDIKPKKEADTDFIKAIEQRKVGIYTKRSNVPSYDLQVSAEDIFVRKEFKEMRCEMPGTPRSTFLMVFSPDGTKVASTHGNHNIHVTDIRSGRNIRTLIGHPRTPWCIAFHPTSNQILASGCLGGQVRIWDLSGGSEVWTADTQTVIASIAFHPDERLLVIATYNELYFWDWSKPEPFTHVSTNSIKEKVRYVAFDKLGQKLITGIANSPQTRWERVRAPVPVPRQVDRAASPYRRRITPRLISNNPVSPPMQSPQRTINREPLSTVPERERRITACYRNLVREYELLVHRYLQLYRPPTMIDQGTDPMDLDLNNITTPTAGPSTSGLQNSQNTTSVSASSSLWSPTSNVAPSTSGMQSHPHTLSPPRRLNLPNTISTTGNTTSSAFRRKSRNPVLYSESSTTTSHSDSLSNSSPIDLSRCCESARTSSVNSHTCITSPAVTENQHLPTDATNFRRVNSTFNPRNSISATQAFETTPACPHDMVLLTPSEICSLRRTVRNFRSTQTQDIDPSTDSTESNDNLVSSVPSTSGIQNRNERRNSAPASSAYDIQNVGTHKLRKGESEEKLPQNSTNTTGRRYVNVAKNNSGIPKVVVVKSSTTHNPPDNNAHQISTSSASKLVVIRSSSSNSPSTSATQTQSPRRLLIISTSLGTQTVDDKQQIEEGSEDSNFKIRIRCSPKTGTAINKNEKPKKLEQNTETLSNSSEEPSTSLGTTLNEPPKSNLSNLLQNAEKFFSKYFVTHDLSKQCSKPAENSESSTASCNIPQTLSKVNDVSIDPGSRCATGVTESPKFYEQARKRVYPGFSKKASHRPVLDTSSNTSSSDEDDRSKRHVPSSRILLNSKNFYFTSKSSSTVGPQPTSNIPSTTNELENDSVTSQPIIPADTSASNLPGRRPLNFNAELELLVTDLLANSDSTINSEVTPLTATPEDSVPSNTINLDELCGSCGGRVDIRNCPTLHDCSRPILPHCARTNGNDAPRNLASPSAQPTNTNTYARPGSPRRRFFSAFYPTRIQNLRSCSRLRRSNSFLSPVMRNRLRSLNTLQGASRLPGTFALDEVINYSERANSEEEIPEPPVEFHPFDPPPEFATINPENIGIGNMYSNIVQELESSLNDVRNIRASNRLGETSDMLSSFSERLESIMNQSNSILRNLRTSIDTLTPTPASYETRQPPSSPTPRTNSEPQLLFNDRNFYLREQGSSAATENNFETTDANDLIDDPNTQDMFSSHSAVAADHTYPLNSRNPQTNSNIMTPLMVSLHVTVSHIQRQARLLRQQVESIERIDRAMLEVAQLQLVRQLFAEMQRYIRANRTMENRSTVSSVRQMMAGTRISDSSPYDSPNEETSTENQQSRAEAGPSTSNASTNSENQSNATQNRNQNRKTYPRCIFLMHRNLRRGTIGNVLQRGYLRERIMRRERIRRAFACRSPSPRTPIDLSTNRNTGTVNQYTSNLYTITRRLEHFLMDHGRNIGRTSVTTSAGANSTDRDEYVLMIRLNHCRARVNAMLGYSEYFRPSTRRLGNSVTADGASRFGAREMLTSAAYALGRYIETGIPSTPSLRLLVWDVIDLSVLLSEILLLQIVDSIPPPTGMNLDPERESLSARIDQMCSRILQSRLSGHSHQLTRSLRLTRIAVRHASRALDQTYTARRNAMLPSGNERDQRRELLSEIHSCLRNIRRNHMAPHQPTPVSESTTPENLSMREWFRTIHGHISQYTTSPTPTEAQPSTSNATVNAETGEQLGRPRASYEQMSSDDDNDGWYNNNNNNNGNNDNVARERTRPLYRTNNVNLLHNEETSNNRNRPWNVPTVQVNDIPISQYQSQWHPRFLSNRQRLSERLSERVSELRTYTIGGLYRPRFLHPLYAGVNPFDADLDDSTREQIYDSDIIAAVSPHHRIQVWEFSLGIPNITNALKNVVVNECRIHNDASVAIAADGSILVALLPSGGYMNIANRLGVYSLEWESLGQCLYVATFEQNAVSVSLSPLSRHLVVGLTSRRVSIIPSDKWTMARIFMLDEKQAPFTQLSSIRDVEQNRDPNYMSVNCIRWLPLSGQGLIYGTNTGQLRVLT